MVLTLDEIHSVRSFHTTVKLVKITVVFLFSGSMRIPQSIQ